MPLQKLLVLLVYLDGTLPASVPGRNFCKDMLGLGSRHPSGAAN
ncbi:hypothetical protein [Methylophaga lonarensis]